MAFGFLKEKWDEVKERLGNKGKRGKASFQRNRIVERKEPKLEFKKVQAKWPVDPFDIPNGTETYKKKKEVTKGKDKKVTKEKVAEKPKPAPLPKQKEVIKIEKADIKFMQPPFDH